MRILRADTSREIGAAKALFLEYAASLDFELCFQSFDEELAGLPGDYAPPTGVLLLAVEAGASRGETSGAIGPARGAGSDDAGGYVASSDETGGCVTGSDEAVGCVALRRLDEETCEIKRLYVRQPFRGRGAGRALAEAAVAEARRIGYKRMRLDAIRNMTAAVNLYASMGFEEIPPYRHNPIPGAVYLELSLE